MSDYSDKDFSDLYEEIIENVNNLTTKWDPSVSDESDPGVVILKTLALLADKLNYKINYRNAQNSVEDVTDETEGSNLFKQLGYQMKKRRSATGEISVKYYGDDSLEIPLFTEFTNSTGSVVFTSIRAYTSIDSGVTKSILVQEGSPTQYTYESREVFTTDDLSENLRLSLYDISDLSDNGIVLVSSDYVQTLDGTEYFLGSDWLNVGDDFFNTVETDNIFSLGEDTDGTPYIQFYEESLEGLKDGVYIWYISSSGSAGNLSANKLTRISSTLETGDQDSVSIGHNSFTNGSDAETLDEARQNYYESFGVCETLISERDYESAISGVIDSTLSKIVSQALVTGVDGNHNLVEILTILSNGNKAILTRSILSEMISEILVNVLDYNDDYYSSFNTISDTETERLIKKSLFKQDVATNDLVLVDSSYSIYDRIVFDVVSAVGTVFINSNYDEDDIIDEIVEVIKSKFNSRNLTKGEMVDEITLANTIKDNISGIEAISFYYKDHSISKSITSDGTDSDGTINIEDLTVEEKRDLVARTVLKGEATLFSTRDIQVLPGVNNLSLYPDEEEKTITRIIGTYESGSGSRTLSNGEFIQFYKKTYTESVQYGYGLGYTLKAIQTTLSTQTLIDPDQTTTLVAGSVIAAGSQILAGDLNLSYLTTYLDEETYNKLYDSDGNLVEGYEEVVAVFAIKYTVQDELTITGGSDIFLESGSIIYDGSTLNGETIYALTIENEVETTLKEGQQLIIETSSSDTSSRVSFSSGDVIMITGFTNGLSSSGEPVSNITSSSLSFSRITNTSQYISEMATEGDFSLDSSYRYGIYLLDSSQLTLGAKESYILKEGEHLIYSDENLVDFVDLGSGTLIENETNSEIVLSNLISLDSDNLAESLINFPSTIHVYNTTIYTFQDVSIEASSMDCFPTGTWEKIGDNNYIDVIDEDGTETTFGDEYYVRGGIIISTNGSGIFSLISGENLDIYYEDGDHTTIRGGDNIPTIISFNQELFVNTLDTDFSLLNVSLASYTLTAGENTNNINYSYSDYLSDNTNSLIIELNSQEEETLLSNERAYWSLNSESLFLIEIEVNVTNKINIGATSPNSASSRATLKLLNHSSTEFNTTVFNNAIVCYQEIPSGTYQFLASSSAGGTIGLYFEFLAGCQNEDTISITSFRELTGINEQLSTDNSSGEYLNGDDDLILNLTDSEGTSEGDLLLNKIMEFVSEGSDDEVLEFDYTHEPSSPLKYPTEPEKYYDTSHPLNRNILTVFDIDFIRENLRIVKR